MAEEILFLDFSSNSEIDDKYNHDKIYKVGLREQFEKLANLGDYDEFVTQDLAKNNVEIGISYPNFERHEVNNVPKTRWYNIAVRIHTDREYDLVLMCDLDQYQPKNKPLLRSLKVKGFTLLDCGVHACGELTRKCNIFTCLSGHIWNNASIEPTQYLSEDQINSSVLSVSFLNELNKMYVAEPHEKVLDRLNKWQLYLDSKNEILKKDLGVGYSIDCTPDLILAYYKDTCTDEERNTAVKYLAIKSKKELWSTENLPNSQPAPLLHIAHDFPKKEYDENPELKKKFERFTSHRSLLLSEEITYVKNQRTNEMEPKYNSATKLTECRISSQCEAEEIQNTEKIKSLLEQCKKDKNALKNEINEEKKKDITSRLNAFKNHDLKTEMEQYKNDLITKYTPEYSAKRAKLIEHDRNILLKKRSDNESELSKMQTTFERNVSEIKKTQASLEELQTLIKKATASMVNAKTDEARTEASGKLKKLKDEAKVLEAKSKSSEEVEHKFAKEQFAIKSAIESINTDLEQLENKYALSEMINTAIKSELEAHENEVVKEQQRIYEKLVQPDYDTILEKREKAIDDSTEEEVNTVLLNETRIRLHVFYRLDMEQTSEPEIILNNIQDKIKGKRVWLYKDPSGDKAILNRQSQALINLKNGYVMNPFLATALFNSNSQDIHSEAEITQFYSKRLNDKQKSAIRKAISSNGMFLIRGPPGTGKTEVIAEITAQLVANGKKVLIASENHKAVDNAFQRLPEIPILRRVRLFGGYATKKEEKNNYAVGKLTQNFYYDIAKCLEEEVRKASSSRIYADKLDQIIADFKTRVCNVKELKSKADSVISEIEEKEVEIERLNKKISRDLKENTEFDIKISELKETMKGIENCESDFFDKYAAEINLEFNKKKLSPEMIRALFALRKTELNKEYIEISEHPEFFNLFKEKYDAKEESEKKRIDLKILEAQEQLGINAFEYVVVKLFPEGIPEKDALLDLKEQVTDAIDSVIEKLQNEIKEQQKIRNDPSRNEQAVRYLEKDIQELKSDKSMLEYENARLELDAELRGVLSDNNILGNFKTIDEGIEYLVQEKSHIQKSATNGLSEELQNAYKKMANYLREESIISKDQETLNEQLLDYANVIGLTCTTKDNIKTDAGTIDLKRVNLDVVIIDEVSKVSFLEVLYPILYGKTVILVGDDKQLPPTYQSNISEDDMSRYDPELVNSELEKEFQHMYETSFFKELYLKTPDCNKAMLTVQYRMHPQIMDADNIFYDGKLSYGGAAGNREHYLEIKGNGQRKIITKDTHLVFIDVEGEEQKGYSGGTSYINTQEIEVIQKLLKKLEYSCTKDANGKDLGGRKFTADNDSRLSLGVICGYSDQAKLIRNKLKGFKFQSFNRKEDEQFMVDTVDNFQGDERDTIVLSLVRSHPERSFMTKFNRINVAISRARCLLVVVGNATAFSNLKIELDGKTDYVYRKIVEAAKSHHGFFKAKDVLGE